MREYEYPDAPSPSTGLPWYKIWLKALIPEGQAYETIAADPGASIGKACLWVFTVYLVCYGIMFLLCGAFLGLVALSKAEAIGEDMYAQLGTTAIVIVCLMPILAGVIGVIGLFLMSGLSHVIASMLGGTGSFTRLTYTFGAFMAPLIIVSMVISFIPLVNYLGFIVGIYGMVLSVMAIKAVHQLDWGRAIASSGVLWLGVLGCVAGVVIVILTLLEPSVGNVFSNIIENLATPTPSW